MSTPLRISTSTALRKAFKPSSGSLSPLSTDARHGQHVPSYFLYDAPSWSGKPRESSPNSPMSGSSMSMGSGSTSAGVMFSGPSRPPSQFAAATRPLSQSTAPSQHSHPKHPPSSMH